jgi:hypothetical protein
MSGVFPSNVVTADHLQPLLNDIATIKAAQHEQDLAMQAGIGNHATTAILEKRLERLMLIKKVYFPGH